MEREETDLWQGVQIDPAHLTDDELKYECTIRGVYGTGMVQAAYRVQLTHSLAEEEKNGLDPVDTYRIDPTAETLQADFTALLELIKATSNAMLQQLCMTDGGTAEIKSRLLHYKLRLERFPQEQFDSADSIQMRQKINQLMHLLIKLQRPVLDQAVTNELVDGLSNPAPLNSTILPPEIPATEHNIPVTSPPVTHNPPAEHSLHHSEQIQTSESFRVSPSFHAYAHHTTPPCMRAQPLNVQFQAPMTSSQPRQTNWSFHSVDVPHSTRTAVTNSADSHMQPITTTHHISPVVSSQSHAMPHMHTIPLMSHELDQSQMSGATREVTHESMRDSAQNMMQNTSHRSAQYERSANDSFARQAGSELQALKRWLGPKTFEGELIDSKHYSIDEFLSHLNLCVKSGICTEDTLLRNLGPTFTGRAFKWWSTSHVRIRSFTQLTEQLKLRFATYAGSVEGLMSAIYGRRQQRNESLPDFVDSMQHLMDQLPNHFTEPVRISTIISCALPEESKLLRSRHYSDISDFTKHVAFLSQFRPKPFIERSEKKITRDKPVYLCDIDPNESNSDPSDEEDNLLDVQAITTALQKAGLKIKRATKPGSEQKKSKASELDNKAKDRQTAASDPNARKPKTQCFGCGTPDVYFSNCVKCQANPNGNQQKRDVYCFGCGTPNVYFSHCESCQSKKSKNGQPDLTKATS